MAEAKAKDTAAASTDDETFEPDVSTLDESRILRFDPSDWTIGDCEDLEEITGGLTIGEVLTPALRHDSSGQVIKDGRGRPVRAVKMPARTMKAIVWIERRRKDPDYTLDDARSSKVTALVLEDSEPDPKDSASATGKSSSSRGSAGSTGSRRRKSSSSRSDSTT